MHVRRATIDDLPTITAILNHEIETSTANFDVVSWTVEQRAHWFEAFDDTHPIFVCTNYDRVLGFAYYAQYRAKAAYAQTKECTVYVAQDAQGRGVGSALYTTLIDYARKQDVHVLLGVLTSGNHASEALHRKHGFVHVGHLREVGNKHGQWLDTDYWQRVL